MKTYVRENMDGTAVHQVQNGGYSQKGAIQSNWKIMIEYFLALERIHICFNLLSSVFFVYLIYFIIKSNYFKKV